MLYAKIAALALAAIIFVAPASLWAVGYEKIDINGQSAYHAVEPKPSPGLGKALAEASFVKKYPQFIDDAAAAVKDILGQFGIVKTEAP